MHDDSSARTPQDIGSRRGKRGSPGAVRKLGPKDSELRSAAGMSLGRAFHEEPNFTYVLPDAGRRSRGLPWFFRSLVLGIALRRGVVDVMADGSGAAVWLGPESRVRASDALASGILEVPIRLGMRGAWRSQILGGAVEGERLRRMTEPHWYLMALGVAPESQGQGIGRLLLQHGLRRADHSGTRSFLETFRSRTAEFYARHGFEKVSEAHVGRRGPPFITMAR